MVGVEIKCLLHTFLCEFCAMCIIKFSRNLIKILHLQVFFICSIDIFILQDLILFHELHENKLI